MTLFRNLSFFSFFIIKKRLIKKDMNKILIIIFLCFLNTINSFGYEIPDQYLYCNLGYGAGFDESSLVNCLRHNFGYNLTLFDFATITIEEKHNVVFIYPFGLKVNVFIEYEGIKYFGYEKYIPPGNNNKGYYIPIHGEYTPRINSGIEILLLFAYYGLIPAYDFSTNTFQLLMQMRSELCWYLTNETGLKLSLSITPYVDLIRIEEKKRFPQINILIGIISNPQRGKKLRQRDD